jgi:hypothetical protein
MAPRHVLSTLLAAGTVAALSAIPASAGTPGTVDFTTPAARDTDPVVLTGKDLLAGSSQWAVPENLTAEVPSKDVTCFAQNQDVACPEMYNHYEAPDADTSTVTGDAVQGTPTGKILGYKWDGAKFVQIPFQVDEVFTRYLNNDASGFGVYSGTDKHTTYAYDREGFRYWRNGTGDDICKATRAADDKEATDPVKGLDSNDELAFMASDAGAQAPSGAAIPGGIAGLKVVTIADPTNPAAPQKYVYIMRADDTAAAPKPAFDASNGYVNYDRDDNFDTLVYSKSSYGDYGPAKQGPYCTPDGKLVKNAAGQPAIGPRRELDTVTISTPRYRFRYDGRWLMTGVQIATSPQDPFSHGAKYGPDVVDRWKARAFAQDPNSNTPCCGYEEEDTNWGGSSSLLGERVGPVRAIRETWGADSGTNVIRRETFYRDRMVQKNWLRVHVIPPADGIYAQWDFNAGRMTRFFNAYNKDGLAVDGVNDEAYGNFDDPCTGRWDGDSRSQVDETFRSTWQNGGICGLQKKPQDLWDQLLGPYEPQDPSGHLGDTRPDYYHQSMDPGDASFAEANASLGWSEVAGPNGAIVDRIHSQATDLTPGGGAQSVAAAPYYRDDACFDDGTGSDPGPELHPRHFDQEQATGANGARRCWTPADGVPNKNPHDGDAVGDDKFWQGDIGAHGLHLLFQVDSDNARTTVPISEIVSDWDLVMLPPSQVLDPVTHQPKNIGEQYGRELEKPLVAIVSDKVQ